MSNSRQCQVLANRLKKFIKGDPKKTSYEIGKNYEYFVSDISLKLSGFDEPFICRKSLRRCKSVNDQLTTKSSLSKNLDSLSKDDLDNENLLEKYENHDWNLSPNKIHLKEDLSKDLDKENLLENNLNHEKRRSPNKIHLKAQYKLNLDDVSKDLDKENLDDPSKDDLDKKNLLKKDPNHGNRRSRLRKSKSLKPSSQLFSLNFKQHIYSPSTAASSRLSFEDENEPKAIRAIFPGKKVYNLQTKINGKERRRSTRKRPFLRNFRRTSVRYSSRRKKRKLKSSKSVTYSAQRIPTPLRKSYSGNDVVDGFREGEMGQLFGRFLEDICDENELPPNSIFILLEDLCKRGPSEVGVFRKSGNARIVRELRASLDKEEKLILNNTTPVSIVASLFKDFLRSLPNCLFCSELYEQWLELCSYSTKEEKVYTAQHLCSCIPGSHRILVKLFLYVLNLIASKSDFNMMTSVNLGICLGPSILNSGKKDFNYNPQVSEVVSFMISNFEEIFGENDRSSLERLLLRQTFKKPQENGETKYREQPLSETTRLCGVFSSLDSGISSGFEDNCSDFTSSIPSTPVSCLSLESTLSTDEVDTRFFNVNFQRNNWMRKGVMKKRCSKDVGIIRDLVSEL